jgi:hypothetical protein
MPRPPARRGVETVEAKVPKPSSRGGNGGVSIEAGPPRALAAARLDPIAPREDLRPRVLTCVLRLAGRRGQGAKVSRRSFHRTEGAACRRTVPRRGLELLQRQRELSLGRASPSSRGRSRGDRRHRGSGRRPHRGRRRRRRRRGLDVERLAGARRRDRDFRGPLLHGRHDGLRRGRGRHRGGATTGKDADQPTSDNPSSCFHPHL